MVENSTGLARAALGRYCALPAWVLLSQLFLGVGWLRAGIAHGLSQAWWSGDELLAFLAEERGDTLAPYDLFLQNVVVPFPGPFAAVVVIAELLVAFMLIADVRPSVGLVIGMALNLQFVATGAVNPSVFYLVIAFGIVAWRLEQALDVDESLAVARYGTLAAAVGIAALVPAVATMAPTDVIDDPAIVLIFLMVLIPVVLWTLHLRAEAGAATLASLAPEPTHRTRPVGVHPDAVPPRRRLDLALGVVEKPAVGRPRLTAMEVVVEIERSTGYKFNAKHHAAAARKLGVRPSAGQSDRTIDFDYAEYRPEIDRYLYSDDWVELLCFALATEDGFRELTGIDPVPNEHGIALTIS